MKKFFTKTLASLMMVAGLGFAAQAQNILFEEQFDGGLNGWTVDTVENAGIDTLGWAWTNSANVGAVIIAPNPAPDLDAPTAANGAAFVNFELQRFSADINNVPADPANYGDYIGHLVSPSIDLSDVTGPLNLSWYQVGRILNGAPGFNFNASVSFSIDDGVTWSAEIDAFENWPIRDVFNGEQTITVPSDIGLQGNSNVRLRFTYSQDFYYWMIDDIMIFERTQPDIRANQSFFAIAPNYATPITQLEEFGFLVDIENIGGTDEENVNVNMTIQNEAGAVIFETDQPFGTITRDSLAENVPFGSFTPPSELGTYTATYNVTSDGTDINTGNNTIAFDFEVSQNIFTKEAGQNLTGIAAGGDNSWTMANVFHVPNGGSFADSVSFGITNANAIPGQFITTLLYRWEGDLNEDGQANPDEYGDPLAFNGYTFDGSEDGQLITSPVDIEETAIPLDEGATYILALQYTDNINQVVFFLTTLDHDYGATVFRTDSLGDTRYGTLLDVGNTGDLTTGNFTGGYFVPALRLSLLAITSVTELPSDNIINIYPNPTANELNINLDLIDNTDELRISIVDITGKVHFTQQYDNIQNTTLNYDLRSYTSGSYIVYIETVDGIRSIPLAIQK